MKIEVGQYGRLEDGAIFQRVGSAGNGITVKINGNFTVVSHSENIIKVADTPRELIELDDIVYFEVNNTVYKGFVGDELSSVASLEASRKGNGTCIKILTPNSNGGYDLQWEAE